MKFTNDHFQSLKKSISGSDVDLLESAKAYKEKGYSETRFLWDIFWASKWSYHNRDASAIYLDTHIQTAIKKAVAELGVKY